MMRSAVIQCGMGSVALSDTLVNLFSFVAFCLSFQCPVEGRGPDSHSPGCLIDGFAFIKVQAQGLLDFGGLACCHSDLLRIQPSMLRFALQVC